MALRNIQSHFDRMAAVYGTTTNWINAPELIREVIGRVEDPPILDVGAGPGIITSALPREKSAHAISLDLSFDMCMSARDEGLQPVQGAAEHLPIARATIGTIVCRQALHYFDLELALREWRRVLRRGGTAVVAQIGSTSLAQEVFWRDVKGVVQPLRRRWFSQGTLHSLMASHDWHLLESDVMSVDNARPVDQFFAECELPTIERRRLLEYWQSIAPQESFFRCDEAFVFFRQYWLIWSMKPAETSHDAL